MRPVACLVSQHAGVVEGHTHPHTQTQRRKKWNRRTSTMTLLDCSAVSQARNGRGQRDVYTVGAPPCQSTSASHRKPHGGAAKLGFSRTEIAEGYHCIYPHELSLSHCVSCLSRRSIPSPSQAMSSPCALLFSPERSAGRDKPEQWSRDHFGAPRPPDRPS